MIDDKAHIICTVTNDLTYDQRMHRICYTLSNAGYKVTLVGRELPDSLALQPQPYRQVRLPLKHHSGKIFYLEYNFKLYRWLKQEVKQNECNKIAICAIDLDTIVPCYYVSKQHQLPRLYDAHELFTELTEVKRRPWIATVWKFIERKYTCKYTFGYTVNQFIKEEFYRRYKVNYEVVRNMPFRQYQEKELDSPLPLELPDRFFLYQGAVNEGRAFDQLIPAMIQVPIPLLVVGNGNYFHQLKELVAHHSLQQKVILVGSLTPDQLKKITPKAFAGITLFNNSGLNQYYSLANRFFDYVQAGIPQLCNAYPEYKVLNRQFEVALLVEELTTETIVQQMNKLLSNNVLYQELKQNAIVAANEWCWENESKILLMAWNKVLTPESK